MEGRGLRIPVSTMLIGVLILVLVLAQTQVEAKSCCRSTTARNCYNVCRLPGTPRATCAKLCDCKIITGGKCPKDYPKISTPQDSDAGEEERTHVEPYNINCPTTAARNSFKMCLLSPIECARRFGCSLTPGDVTYYCKLGCAFSVCKSRSTLHNTDAAAEEAVEHCKYACSEFCTKGTNIAMVTA